MDLQAIANGLATTIGTVNATYGGATESLTATAEMPDKVGKMALLVYPPSGDLALILGPKLDDHYTFMVRLLRDPLTMPARTHWLYAWANALRISVQAHFQLGVAGVFQAEARRLRMDFDTTGQPYGAVTGGVGNFDVVEIEVEVHVQELTTVNL